MFSFQEPGILEYMLQFGTFIVNKRFGIEWCTLAVVCAAHLFRWGGADNVTGNVPEWNLQFDQGYSHLDRLSRIRLRTP